MTPEQIDGLHDRLVRDGWLIPSYGGGRHLPGDVPWHHFTPLLGTRGRCRCGHPADAITVAWSGVNGSVGMPCWACALHTGAEEVYARWDPDLGDWQLVGFDEAQPGR